MSGLSYERRASGASATAQPIVLIHGIGSRWQMWEPVLDQLSTAHEVVAVDLPGFGSSPPLPPGTRSDIDGLAQALTDFFAEQELERPHLVGNSLGGWVALELARRGHARSVTVFSPAGFAGSLDGLGSRAALRLSVWVARRVRSRADGLSQHRWFRDAAYRQMVAKPRNVEPEEVAGSIRAMADATGFDDTLRWTARQQFHLGAPLDVPVTIAWGDHDWLLPRWQARRALAEVPGARLVRLPGCGHIPTYDDPELVARVILDGSRSA